MSGVRPVILSCLFYFALTSFFSYGAPKAVGENTGNPSGVVRSQGCKPYDQPLPGGLEAECRETSRTISGHGKCIQAGSFISRACQ